jgi:hypothetical protein
MVVCYFNVIDISVFPAKTDPPLIVDPDTVLSFTVSLQGFQPVSGRDLEVLKVFGPMQVQEPPPRDPFDRMKLRHVPIIEQCPGFVIAEGPNHMF